MALRCHEPELVGNWAPRNSNQEMSKNQPVVSLHSSLKAMSHYDSRVTCVEDRQVHERMILYLLSIGYILFWTVILPLITYR